MRIGRTRLPRYLHFLLFSTMALLLAQASHAVTYGVYEPRALAMGSVGVAAATPQQAQFYNPALMAFHNQRAEESLSGRFYAPVVAGQAPEVVLELVEMIDSDLDQRITNTVDAFNADRSQEVAQQAFDDTDELRSIIEKLEQQSLAGEAFLGMAVVEPDVRGGGAFHVAARVVAGARADIHEADRERLDQYLEVFEFYVDQESGDPPHPQLFTDENILIDPTDTVESTVTGRGAAIIEWGVTGGKEFHLGGQAVALGITPKLMEVRAYEEVDQVVEGGLSSFNNSRSHLTGNVDLGIAVELDFNWRAGLAVKDVLRQSFSTSQGSAVVIRPKVRGGVAYVQPRYTIGLDFDLLENRPIGFEDHVRDVALGAEASLLPWLHARAGFTYNLAEKESTGLAGGLGLELGRLLVDVAYSQQSEHYAASFQLGWAF